MPRLTNSSRVPRLQKRFLDILSGAVQLDPRGATLFLEGLCVQDDPVVCLKAIIDSAHGLSCVQSAMRSDLSANFMNGIGSNVLEYLLRASNVGDNSLDDLLFHVVEPPIFWDAFIRTFKQGALDEDAQLVFARLLSRLLTLHGRDTTSHRAIAAEPLIQDRLLASPRHEIREIVHLINHILSSAGLTRTSCALNGPGGRHDNDFAEFRDIAILPTADEILCKQPPFLRPAFHDELSESETPIDDYLDNTFRMLREDMLFDIRDELDVTSQKKGKHHSVHEVTMIDIHTATDGRQCRWGVQLQCGYDFKQLKHITDEDARVEFLKRNPRGIKIMKHQSLVCLVSDQDIVSFGTVNRVESLLARNPPVIILQLDGAVNIRRTITALYTSTNIRLIQINAATFSFEPVLTELQYMPSVSLSREIILWNSEKPAKAPRQRVALSHIANEVASDFSIDLCGLLDFPTSITLDRSQAKSLVAGLTKRVSLIQGPPGTGKSFIGTILAKAIHDKTSQTVLIVCYTNHALDQFLGDLLNYGIPEESIVRLGGRSSQAMEALSLRNQPRGGVQYDWSTITALREDASDHERQLRAHFCQLLNDNDTHFMDYLRDEHDEFSRAFYVPSMTEDGMTFVGENGRAIDHKYLFWRWVRGQDAGVLSGEPHVQASPWIWGMDHSARQQLLDTWWHGHVTKLTESIIETGTAYNEAQDRIKRQFAEATVATLRKKRIIACTTTGAAINADVIKAAGPQFLLVEEAGEILEGHILTALSQKVDQMILIGDHKQLRPKVNSYQLTVERGEGFDLNRSLFERLVLKGYPHETLSTQHRMRPEISAFVRELTYPELVDAPSTLDRPDIRGVQSNIIFVDHSHPEDESKLFGDRADNDTKASKQNTYEVQMVLKIVRYLAQQDYKGEDIVVLTPYLGQLHQLRDALKHDNDPILNDLDSTDLSRAGVLEAAPPGRRAKKGRIRLATIDNYQGEESDIVVASLTRSNSSNAIGFMDSPERLNVLLSRARNGLILIGNSQTFLRSKRGGALWGRFFSMFEKGAYIYQGFPVKCEKHPGHTVLLKHASDFDVHCPDGGCTNPCGFMLDCGHACLLKCHPRASLSLSSSTGFSMLDLHDTSRCRYILRATCPAGRHEITWECRSEPPSVCSECERAARRQQEMARKALEQQRRRELAEAEHRRRMAELEASLRVAEVALSEKECDLEEVQEKQEEGLVMQGRQQEDEAQRQEEGKRKRKREEQKKKEAKARREKRKKRKQEAKQEKKEEEKKKQEKKKENEDNETKRLQPQLIRLNQVQGAEEQGKQAKRPQQAVNKRGTVVHPPIGKNAALEQELAILGRIKVQAVQGGRKPASASKSSKKAPKKLKKPKVKA